ncbi:unnamed protein product [Fraxinus pennsylvanica]|uniref:Protein kinase domain-containing protein n=1 Tax=Fraxinus pennsylvanica TaxID=56036 RepID=A0AAD1YXE5_9LAMI|nr:unnamed protein product [Fraxinus pennsylvanica]
MQLEDIEGKKLVEKTVDFEPGTTLWVSYYGLMQATEGYSKSHLLGAGSFGSVYRGTLNNGRDVAVKVFHLHLQNAFKSFDVECEPSNVLLNEDMVAHLCDFGIAKLLGEGESNVYTTTLGTLGYIAPEYGLEGLVSSRCDVYSYGITLTEVFTRKKPSSESFSGDISLRSWVNDSMPNAMPQIMGQKKNTTQKS